MGGSYYPILCSILSTGKDRKTPQRYPDVPTTSWIISIQSMDSQTINQLAGGKLRDLNAEESWAFLEDLALYDNKSWNDPRDFTKLVKIRNGPHDTQYCMEDPKQAFVEYASSRTDKAGEKPLKEVDETNEFDDKLAKSVRENVTKNEEEESA
ncbi:hypothetical protein Tco_1093147 [Tanacetum coccineum]|uniref:MAK10-like protein n=1 Tax=Tanacetum coccineum TaxID=301880 RepID=A0ABQ5IBV6_9ASTR